MEPEGSLQYSQVSATFPYPKPTLSSPRHPLHYIILVSEFNKTWIFFNRLSKNNPISHVMKIRPLVTELFHVDRWRDMNKLIEAFLQFFECT
jgi:hypothetical protein